MNNKFCSAFLFSFFLFAFSSAQPTITLDEVVQMALEKNFDIKVMRATSATQFTDKRFIYGAFLPTVNLAASHIENKNNSLTSYFPSATRADVNIYNVESYI